MSWNPFESFEEIKEYDIPVANEVDYVNQLKTPNRDEKFAMLIDWPSFFHKYYFWVAPYTTPSFNGKNVNAIHTLLLKVLNHISSKPDYLFIVWEGGKTFRNDILPTYKANRTEKEENLKWQMQVAHKLFIELGLPSIFVPWYEADDVMYSLTQDLREKHWDKVNIYIHTSDKDYFQIADNEKTYICRSTVWKKKELTPDEIKVLKEKNPIKLLKNGNINKSLFENVCWFPQEKFIDYLACIGDKSDNIPWILEGLWETRITKLFQNKFYWPEDFTTAMGRMKIKANKLLPEKLLDWLQWDLVKERFELNKKIIKLYQTNETKKLINNFFLDNQSLQEKFTYNKVIDLLVQKCQFEELLAFINWIFNSNNNK